jgi:hypothetical protein
MMEGPQKKRGNPNPSPATRFRAGERANPNGKTAEQKRIEMRNAEAAMRIRERLLSATEAKLVELSVEEIMELIEPAMLKLLTDSETRGLGSPVQDIRSGDGSMTPKPSIDLTKAPPELLEWIVAQSDAANTD